MPVRDARSDRRLRILIVIPDFGVGGAERVTVDLLRALDPAAFQAVAISLYGPDASPLERHLRDGGVPVRYLGKRPGPDLRMVIGIARVLREHRPDVVHTHRSALRYVLPLALRRRRPAVVHTVHSLADRETDRTGRWIRRRLFGGAATPVAVAEAVAHSLRTVYGLRTVPVIRNGIPLEGFQPDLRRRAEWRQRAGFRDADILFACVARLQPEKNHRLLLEAFAAGPARAPGTHLLIAGDGPLRRELEGYADRLGLSGQASFLGFRTDVPDLLNAADGFVLPSAYEGCPISVMEAMALGLPVVATAVGGVAELVRGGRTGLLVAPGDLRGLAQALTLLLDRDRRHAMGGAGRRVALQEFSAQTMVRAYEDLYRSVAARAARPPRAGEVATRA